MSITNPTSIDYTRIGLIDRRADVLRAEVWRTVNGIGSWRLALRNTAGKYNSEFDVQDDFWLTINGNTLMRGRVDGPAVYLQGSDVEDIWDEYAIVSGYDRGQDLLFHNDFEQLYPDPTQTLDDVLLDVINVQLAGLTNIFYAGLGGTPAVGAIEFRVGSGFLSTLQELFQRAEYLFYVDDSLTLNIGSPGFSDSGVTATCEEGGANNNIIGTVNFQRRDGDKLYNKIYVYGKTPQFDAYTEYLANRWTNSGVNWSLSDETVTIAPITGNDASIRTDYVGGGAPTQNSVNLDFSQMGQDEVDMSSGEIGFWWRYDGGGSAARACAQIGLQDNAFNVIYFYSGPDQVLTTSNINSTRTYKGVWGWCRAPIGYDVETGVAANPDTWYGPYPGVGFNWDRVTDIAIGYYHQLGIDQPNEMEVDGLELPFPAVGFAEDIPSQNDYRVRPLVINAPYYRNQLTLEWKAEQLLTHHKDSGIDLLKFTMAGNIGLRYAGQTITVNIPDLGLNDSLFYMSKIHHIIEPYFDVSEGYGFDWITEIEAVPINSIAYDMGRLRDGALYSATQLGTESGVGQRTK